MKEESEKGAFNTNTVGQNVNQMSGNQESGYEVRDSRQVSVQTGLEIQQLLSSGGVKLEGNVNLLNSGKSSLHKASKKEVFDSLLAGDFRSDKWLLGMRKWFSSAQAQIQN